MKKAAVINSLKSTSGIILVFGFSYILGLNLIVPLSLVFLFLYLRFVVHNLKLRNGDLLNLLLLFVIISTLSYFMVRRGWPTLYIPFSFIPMLVTILFGRLEIALLMTLASSVTIGAIANNNYLLGVLTLISGILSSILVWGVRRRMSVIRAGFLVGLVQMLCLFFINHFEIPDLNVYTILMFNGVVSSIIVLGILPIFEYLFRTVTNISLLELADFHHPLLQRLVLEAPGTYHHSLVVGNLSEAASQAVGANALLARIGAYYHDIGKLKKPSYFSENQSRESDKHEELSPTMSRLVIMNHVKEGQEFARKHKLNPRLIDFIIQHHGTSLVYYFYRRALETKEEDVGIKEEGFRYPGPKPNSKETAIVLLADSVEAATRALKDPHPPKIKEIVYKVINNKFIDGQLDECDLTLKDLEKISAVFIRILSGIYHSRITYPEQASKKNSGSSRKKSSKTNSYQLPDTA